MVQERTASTAFETLLRQHRLAAGLTQEALAERARMSVDGIGALERGHRQAPYRTTVALLAQALALAPLATSEFAAAALRAPQPRGPRAADPRGESTIHNLPLPASRFLGREKELRELRALIESERVVTLTGTGGIGKTRIALEVAAEYADRRDDGVHFANLAPLSDPMLVTSEEQIRIEAEKARLFQTLSFEQQENIR